MSYKHLKLFLLSAGIVAFATAGAQSYQGHSLDSSSKVLQAHNNDFFIVVDAYKDGIIKDGEAYNISYDKELRINNKHLPKALATAYNNKLNDYWQAANVAPEYRKLQLSGIWDAITLNYQLGNSKFVPCTASPATLTSDDALITILQNKKVLGDTYMNYYHNNAALVKTLCDDGILLKAGDVHIRYNQASLYINGNKLEGEAAKKYKTLVEQIEGRQATSQDLFGYTLPKSEVEYYTKYTKKQ